MYEPFIKSSDPEALSVLDTDVSADSQNKDIQNLFEECGGYSFRKGLYRVHNRKSSQYWKKLICEYFNTYDKMIPFAFDWMGRQFAISLERKNCLLMFDPATAEDFELEQDLMLFHTQDLVNERESILAEELFNSVKKTLNTSKLEYNECLGYKVPLFLSGPDVISNYEVSNIEVYWEIQHQLYKQTHTHSDNPDRKK